MAQRQLCFTGHFLRLASHFLRSRPKPVAQAGGDEVPTVIRRFISASGEQSNKKAGLASGLFAHINKT
jgi:hypothetical protein